MVYACSSNTWSFCVFNEEWHTNECTSSGRRQAEEGTSRCDLCMKIQQVRTHIQGNYNCESMNSKSVGDDVPSTVAAAVAAADVLPLSLH